MDTDRFDYDAVLNLLPDGVVALDRDFTVLQMNRAACRFLGVSDASACIGRPVRQILEDAPFLRLRDGNAVQLSDCVLLAEEGLWIERSYLCDRARTVFVCLLRDITQLRQQEEALQTGRQHVLELADTITEKQLHVVHEIAGLLGETAVETQAAMQELKQAILPVREDRND
ncbi:MAG: PAS domain-containing protein [Candidatus Limivicinus sp.]